MARLKTVFAAAVLAGAVWAQGRLQCKYELKLEPLGSAPPTDVAVDSSERLFVLHEGDGFMDIYNKDGVLLQHRGGQAESRLQPTGVTALSQWVGRLGKSALLVSEAGQLVARGVLLPGPHSLEYVPFSGLKEPIEGSAALARDLEGNYYVWSLSASKAYTFNSQGQYLGARRLPSLRRPQQLAVDSSGWLYCLDTTGLHVVDTKGDMRYEVAGAQAMYLTGSDVLALAGRDWVRRYSPDGEMESDVRDLEPFQQAEPVALSINDQGQYFVYLRNPDSNTGRVVKLSAGGKVLSDFPQPARAPGSPDPGVRLDYQGRMHLWNGKNTLLKLHPSGKSERSMVYIPSADPKGQMLQPADLIPGPDGQIWIADAGNCRLQRFRYGEGWQKPITVGIRDGDPRGVPRSLAFSPYGHLYVVVHPRNRQGDVVLQTRDQSGKLLTQRSLCPGWGDPVVKIASSPGGDLFVYQSRAKTVRGWEEAPTLLRIAPRGQVAAKAGGDGPGLTAPGNPGRRIVLKPQEDLVAWQGKLLVPSGGSVFLFSPELEPLQEYTLVYKQGPNPQFGEFGGAARAGKLLYLVDVSGRCLQRAVLP